jgi:hypothetical protein
MTSTKAQEYMERIDRVLGEQSDPTEWKICIDFSAVISLLRLAFPQNLFRLKT